MWRASISSPPSPTPSPSWASSDSCGSFATFGAAYGITHDRSEPGFLTPVLCLSYILGPIGVYIISALVRPVGASRYLIPYYMSLAALCAYALQHLASQPSIASAGKRLRAAQIATLILVIAALHLYALHSIPPAPALDLQNLPQLANGRPVLVMDEPSFFQLQYYRSSKNLQFHYALPPSWNPVPNLMTTVAQLGYYPGSMTRVDAFEQQYPDFLIITRHDYQAFPWFPNPKTCQTRQLGTVLEDHFPENVYEVSHCRLTPGQSL